MRTLLLLAALTAAVPVVAADAPTSQPAVTTYFPSARNLTYRLPAGWQSSGGTLVSPRYVAGPDASVSLSLMTPGTKMTPEFQQQILQGMQAARKKDKATTAISEPAIEPDDRFALRIHERYTMTDAKKLSHTADDLLLLRVVNDRVVLMSVRTTAADPSAVESVQKAAEQALLSVGAAAATALGPEPAATAALGGGAVTYTPPAGWQPGKTTPTVVSYVTPAHDAILAINLLPTDAAISPAARDAILGQLKAARKKAGTKVVQEPTVEADDRFALKVHEKYEVGRNDGSKKIADQLHLYRTVGPRVVMLTVNTVADDAETIKSIQKTGEDVLLTAQLKGAKPKGK